MRVRSIANVIRTIRYFQSVSSHPVVEFITLFSSLKKVSLKRISVGSNLVGSIPVRSDLTSKSSEVVKYVFSCFNHDVAQQCYEISTLAVLSSITLPPLPPLS